MEVQQEGKREGSDPISNSIILPQQMEVDLKDESIIQPSVTESKEDTVPVVNVVSVVPKTEEIDEKDEKKVEEEENIPNGGGGVVVGDETNGTEEVEDLQSNEIPDAIQLHILRLIKSGRNDLNSRSRQRDAPTIFNISLHESQWKRILDKNIKTSVKATSFERAPVYRGDVSVMDEKKKDDILELQKAERMRERLTNRLKKHRKGMSIKVQRLRDTYRKLHKGWRIHCDRLDRIKESRQEGVESVDYREETSIKENEEDATVSFKETTTNATLLESPSKPGADISELQTITTLTSSSTDTATNTTEIVSESKVSDETGTASVIADATLTLPTTNSNDTVMSDVNGRRSMTTSITSVSTPAKTSNPQVTMISPQMTSTSNSMSASMTRSNRRNTQGSGGGLVGFGDAVRSEAEFLEILASLESADMQDPNMRAARTTAVEPDMCLDRWSCTASTRILKEESDEVKHSIKEEDEDLYLGERDDGLARSMYDDDNGFVADPKTFYETEFDPDFWSEEEMAIFARRYVLFPKQFGKIAASLPEKTAAQCVSYYYLTKKEDGHDYKALLASKNRGLRRKTRLVKPKKGRGSALMADLKAATPLVGNESLIGNEDDEASPSTPLSPNASVSTSGRKSGTTSGRGRGAHQRRLQQQAESMIDSNESSTVNNKALDVPPTTTAKRGRGAKNGMASTRAKVVETLPVPMEDVEMQSPISAKNLPIGTKPNLEDAMGPNGKARGRQPTSSYWSVAERNQFLRSLAVVGKDWDYVAQHLTTKSAAQARNYFARNEKEADFIEAISLAEQQADKPLEEREEAADKFIQRRTAKDLLSVSMKTSPQMHSGSLVPPPIIEPEISEYEEVEMQNSSQRNGLNISSLLNADGDSRSSARAARRSSLQDWFGGSQQEQSAIGQYGNPSQATPSSIIRSTSPFESHERITPSREEMYSGQSELNMRRSWQDLRNNDGYRQFDSRQQPTNLHSSSRYSSVRSPSMFSTSQSQYESSREYDNKDDERGVSSMHRQSPFSHYRKVESERTMYESVPRQQSFNDDHRSSMMPPPSASSIMSDQRSSNRPYYAPSRPASSYGYSDYGGSSRGQLAPPQSSMNVRHHSAEISHPSEYSRYGGGGGESYREDQRIPPSRQSSMHSASPTPSTHMSTSIDPHRSPVMSSRVRNEHYSSSSSSSYGRQQISSNNSGGRHYYDQNPTQQQQQSMSGSQNNLSHYRSSQGPVSSSRNEPSSYMDSRSPQDYDHRSSRDRRTPPPTLPSPHSPFFGRRYEDQQRHRQ